MERIIIEIFDSHGHRVEYREFQESVIAIGRGYQNDIIITDPYVCPEHVLLRFEGGQWLIEDRSHKNGLFSRAQHKLITTADVLSGNEFIIGKTHLRIISVNHPTPQTKQLIPTSKVFKHLSHPATTCTIVVFMFALFALEAHLASWENFPFQKLAAISTWLVVIATIWAGIWAFVGRLIKHRSQFFEQLVISVLFWITMIPASNITEYAGFLTNSRAIEAVCTAFLGGGAFAFLLIWNLRIATNISRKAQITFATSITILFIAISTLFYFAFQSEFSPVPSYQSTLKPPYIQIGSGKSIDAFLEKSAMIFDIKEYDISK